MSGRGLNKMVREVCLCLSLSQALGVQLGIDVSAPACLLVVRADMGTSMPCGLLATSALQRSASRKDTKSITIRV